MATHVKVLGVLHIIFGLLGLLGAFGIFAGSMLGGLGGATPAAEEPDDHQPREALDQAVEAKADQRH